MGLTAFNSLRRVQAEQEAKEVALKLEETKKNDKKKKEKVGEE